MEQSGGASDLAAFTRDAAVVVSCGLVAAHHAGLVLLQVAGDVAGHGGSGAQRCGRDGEEGEESMEKGRVCALAGVLCMGT